jgi:hypothetical protein
MLRAMAPRWQSVASRCPAALCDRGPRPRVAAVSAGPVSPPAPVLEAQPRAAHHPDRRDAPGDRGDRPSLPGLLRAAVGAVPARALRGAGALDAPPRRGTWDPEQGERSRVRVTLATGIPEDVVRRADLGYLDPAEVDVDAWRAAGDTFVVPDVGEVLFRLR